MYKSLNKENNYIDNLNLIIISTTLKVDDQNQIFIDHLQ